MKYTVYLLMWGGGGEGWSGVERVPCKWRPRNSNSVKSSSLKKREKKKWMETRTKAYHIPSVSLAQKGQDANVCSRQGK